MRTPQEAIMYIVIDLHTKEQVGTPYADIKRARSRATKLDLVYGAHRYIVKAMVI